MNRPITPTAARFLATTMAAVICLAGCSRHEAAAVQHPVSPKPVIAVAAPARAEPAVERSDGDKAHAAELMRAIFGDNYRADDGAALVVIEGGENAGNWRMTPYSVKELSDGRTAVVVNGAPTDENNSQPAAHASPGMLNVYTLRRADGTWRVIERHQELGLMGSSGNIGVVKWIVLGADKPGIVVSSGGTWFGSTIADAQVFDLDHGMSGLGGFREFSSNEGACEPDTKDCWVVAGRIGTVPAARAEDYRDIVVDFTGKHYRVTESGKGDDVEHLTRIVHQTARYRFNGKTYVLVAGENPVPEIDM